MINHFRSLLLNRALPQSSRVIGELGDELVDPKFGFTPGDSSVELRLLRSILLGDDHDRFFLNYRLSQYLTLVHSTPLEPYVYQLDPRITYEPGGKLLVNPALYLPQVIDLTPAGAPLLVSGVPASPDASGVSRHALTVLQTSPGQVQLTRLTRPFQKTDLEFSRDADGYSEPIALTGTGYFVRLPPGSSNSWRVNVLNQPTLSLADILSQLDSAGEPAFLALFGVSPTREPYRTCKSLWELNKESPLRLAAVLVALAYRTEELNTGQTAQ